MHRAPDCPRTPAVGYASAFATACSTAVVGLRASIERLPCTQVLEMTRGRDGPTGLNECARCSVEDCHRTPHPVPGGEILS
jgi:hypothetical protein